MQYNINKLYIFEWFKKDFLEKVLSNSKIKYFSAWDIVIKIWDEALEAYVIINWIVSVNIDNQNINTIFAWDIFWEIALITNEKRTATIIAETALKLLVINKDILIKIINNYPEWEIIKTTILNRIIQNNKKLKF